MIMIKSYAAKKVPRQRTPYKIQMHKISLSMTPQCDHEDTDTLSN